MNPRPGDKFTRRSAPTKRRAYEQARVTGPVEKAPCASWIRPTSVREFVGLAFIFAVEESDDLGSPTGLLVYLTVTPAISFSNLHDKWVRIRERETGSIDTAFQILMTTCATFSTVTPVLFTRPEYRLFLRCVPRIRWIIDRTAQIFARKNVNIGVCMWKIILRIQSN